MTKAVIVQARFGSTRLPGKVLMPLGGRPALAAVLERCARIPCIDKVVCAVPDSASSDAVAAAAKSCGAIVFRGSENDVLARYDGAARAAGAKIVMRVTSDCPLIDPVVAGAVLALLEAHRRRLCLQQHAAAVAARARLRGVPRRAPRPRRARGDAALRPRACDAMAQARYGAAPDQSRRSRRRDGAPSLDARPSARTTPSSARCGRGWAKASGGRRCRMSSPFSPTTRRSPPSMPGSSTRSASPTVPAAPISGSPAPFGRRRKAQAAARSAARRSQSSQSSLVSQAKRKPCATGAAPVET